MSPVVIIRSRILNPSWKSVSVPKKYRPLFPFCEVTPGWHTVRFAVNNTRMRRLLSDLEHDFKGTLKIEFGAAGVEE